MDCAIMKYTSSHKGIKFPWIMLDIIIFSSLYSNKQYSETIPASIVDNFEQDEFFRIIYYGQTAEAPTLAETCAMIEGCVWGFHPGRPSDGPACWNRVYNRVPYLRIGVCAYGPDTTSSPMGMCVLKYQCPNSSWTLSETNKTCFRPDFSCWIKFQKSVKKSYYF